ncbi:hypothetical protein EPIR_2085 [Erwinia piriflorinigrans CFBP 5888]|uniref:Uncharacterized protein n=1 Tax=Erwinia piriflorinigrans CFBP 5888 TaxID=1161919 RepID=V5Z932_9GAMM|nr:hypothetical protein EPIR_2085 [Erwinia piriflorinigrans CFBP 5888]
MSAIAFWPHGWLGDAGGLCYDERNFQVINVTEIKRYGH